jgi:hypothetical protein
MSKPGSFGLTALLLLAAYTAIFYARSFSSGLISDGWVMLQIGSRGLARAPLATLSYHVIPVANLFVAVLWKLFGQHGAWYQALNLAELVLVGWLVTRLGRRLFPDTADARVGLLAGLLFVSNASFYDVPLWPVIGNFHSLAALFYLAALAAVDRALRSARPAPWALAFAASCLLAFFTYEPAVSVLAAGLLYAVFVPAGGLEAGWRAALARTRRLAPALIGVPAVVLASKAWAASAGLTVALPPRGLDALAIRLYLLVRACIGLFTLRGSDSALYAVFSFGSFTPIGPIGGRPFLALVGLWLLGLAGLAALLLAKAREPAVRFLVAWLATHLLLVSAGIDVVSRHCYLAALPASLLASWALWRLADRTGAGVVLGVVALLAAGARTDLDVAAALHREATEASRQVGDLVLRRLAAGGPPPRVTMVNMPGVLLRDGMSAFIFGNGLTDQVWLVTEARIRRVQLLYTYAAAPPGMFANGSRETTLAALATLARDPGNLVLAFDPRTRQVGELDAVTAWRAPEAYTPDSAPYLEWQDGSWPWFRLLAGRPLELPLATDAERSWIALRYLRGPGVAFSATAGTGPLLAVEPREGAAPAWPAATFQAPGGPVLLTLRPHSEVWLAGVWAFAPPPAYTPESSPFLGWSAQPVPAFGVVEPLLLPLSPPSCPPPGPCRIRLEALIQPGCGLAAAVGDGPAQELGVPPGGAPAWLSLDLAGEPAVVRLTPRGAAPPMVRRLGWASASDPLQPSAP